MLLTEIFNVQQKERDSDFEHWNEKARQNARRNELGQGSFGTVKGKKNDPFMVAKHSNLPVHDLNYDPYYVYIKYIIDNDIAQHNPYAPRVYKLVHLTDQPNNRKKYKIDMEKLEPSSQVDIEDWAAVYHKIKGEDIDFDSMFDAELTTMKALRGIIMGSESTVDEHLAEMGKIIRKIKESKDYFQYDLPRRNVMFRRSTIGTQLVIVDPLWNVLQTGT